MRSSHYNEDVFISSSFEVLGLAVENRQYLYDLYFKVFRLIESRKIFT